MDKDFLEGQFLVAMPTMGDPRFVQSLIFVFVHNEDGAMGFVVNRAFEGLNISEIIKELNLPEKEPSPGRLWANRLLAGGPVETSRAFLLLPAKEGQSGARSLLPLRVSGDLEDLRSLSQQPEGTAFFLVLGYVGWAAGQLENEMAENVWLHAPYDDDLLFSTDFGSKWNRALISIGVDPTFLAHEAGEA